MASRLTAAARAHAQRHAPTAKVSAPRKAGARKPCVLKPGTPVWSRLWAQLTVPDPGDRDIPDEHLPRRPRTRAECVAGPRPCPWLSCPFHRYLSVSPRNGAIWINCPDVLPWEMADSCVLDLIEEHAGGATLEAVGELSNFSKERARQVEQDGLAKLATPELRQLYEELRED